MELPVTALTITEQRIPAFIKARSEIEAKAVEILSSLGPEGSWVISQSLGDGLTFDFFNGKLPDNFEQSIAGRVFGQAGEIRWVRETEGCRFWVSVEGTGTPCRRRDKRYYLWGMFDPNGTFSENRIPGAWAYPLPGGITPAIDDRAFIEVAEYLPAKPSVWPESIQELEALLNQPEVLGHRFLTVGCGRDK